MIHEPPTAATARPRTSALRLLLSGLLLTALALPIAAATQKETAPQQEKSEHEQDLRELRGRIESLRKGLASQEESRNEAADQLRASERSISESQRRLRQLASESAALQQELRRLAQERAQLEGEIREQQETLSTLISWQYRRGPSDALHLLLNGDDPNRIARDLHYLTLIARERNTLMDGMRSALARKAELAAESEREQARLQTLAEEQQEQHRQLQQQRGERQKLVNTLAGRIADQRKEIGALRRDEKRLATLIERLSRLIAERAAAERAAAERAAAARRAEGRKPAPEAADKEGVARSEQLPTPVVGVDFPKLRGSLRLPVRGTVSNRFGAPRREGSHWKGLLIRSEEGSEVHAIAAGRIVFSEWMRGFGNLLIIDHGDSYLSIYGYNEALLRKVGDSVRGGDPVATVGRSGGHAETGLYFELRHQGQPLDPMKWVTLK